MLVAVKIILNFSFLIILMEEEIVKEDVLEEEDTVFINGLEKMDTLAVIKYSVKTVMLQRHMVVVPMKRKENGM